MKHTNYAPMCSAVIFLRYKQNFVFTTFSTKNVSDACSITMYCDKMHICKRRRATYTVTLIQKPVPAFLESL